MPLNTRLAPPELQFQPMDSGARLLVNAGALEATASAALEGMGVAHRLVVAADGGTEPYAGTVPAAVRQSTPAHSGAESYEGALQAAVADHPEATVVLGAKFDPARVLDAYEDRGIGFTSCYGMTETAPGVTMLPVGRSREKAGSAGLPMRTGPGSAREAWATGTRGVSYSSPTGSRT